MSDIEKALTLFQGICSGDSVLATRYIDPQRYIEHNPQARGGIEGVKDYVDRIVADHAQLKVIRAYQDGAYVVTQTDGLVLGNGTFFDVFKFQDGLIVEHWVFSDKIAPPNKSGHTQVDGQTEPNPDEDSEKNKSLIRDFYETVHIGSQHDKIPRYFLGDHCFRHEPEAADGLEAFMRDLKVLTRDRTIDRIRLVVGQQDFVFVIAEGTFQGDPCAYVDLYRAENAKIVEHWGFPLQLPPAEMRENANGML